MGCRPNFYDAWRAFSNVNLQPFQVGNIVGGKVKDNFDSGVFTNACAIRFSYVLNTCGCDITRSDDISSVSGGDGRWYIFRVRDVLIFLSRNWGSPEQSVNGPPVFQNDFVGKVGVLAF